MSAGSNPWNCSACLCIMTGQELLDLLSYTGFRHSAQGSLKLCLLGQLQPLPLPDGMCIPSLPLGAPFDACRP